jgi:hypothetical protein
MDGWMDGWMGGWAQLLAFELMKFYSYSVPKTLSFLGQGLMNLNIPPQRGGPIVGHQNKIVIFLNKALMILIKFQ